MKKAVLAASLGLAVIFFGCATDYGSRGITGGYSETQLGPQLWRVGYSGNGFTTHETVQTFWLYRAAELTLQQGYDGFAIVSPVQLLSYPGGSGGDARLYEISATADMSPIYVQYAEKPYLFLDIRLLRKPLTGEPPKVFDAAALKAALEPYVKGKLCDSGNVCPHVHQYLSAPQSI